MDKEKTVQNLLQPTVAVPTLDSVTVGHLVRPFVSSDQTVEHCSMNSHRSNPTVCRHFSNLIIQFGESNLICRSFACPKEMR